LQLPGHRAKNRGNKEDSQEDPEDYSNEEDWHIQKEAVLKLHGLRERNQGIKKDSKEELDTH
jgi:hypothetical protein